MGVVRGLHVLVLVSFIQVVHHVSSMTIDQIISNAATTSKEFEFMDVGAGYVQVELDMRFKPDQWQEIQRMNASSIKTARQRRKAIRNTRARWTNTDIPYEIPRGVFSTRDIQQINNAISDWRMYTCITFTQSSTARNRVRFQDGGGCSSFVGMSRGVQPITLARGCRQKGTIIHEIGHAVGFHHEQTRPDRDRFVRILRENIPSNVFYNFQKYSNNVINTFNVPYDYSSIMHYGGTAFSSNGRLTIQTLDSRFQNVIGNRQGHSFKDIKLANLMYDCAANNNCQSKTCSGEGFVGKDCNCWCPGSPVKRCDGGEIGGGGQTVGTSEPVTERPVTENCYDMNRNCENWASVGECNTNPGYMTMFCKKACDVCEKVKTCEDMNVNCDYWQSQGYCSRMYVQYMRTNCPKACGVCRSDEVPSVNGTAMTTTINEAAMTTTINEDAMTTTINGAATTTTTLSLLTPIFVAIVKILV